MGSFDVCRICESTGDLQMIFAERNRKVLGMLKSFTSSTIEVHDCLPQYICSICIHNLKESYDFKCLYTKTYRKHKPIVLHRIQNNEEVLTIGNFEISIISENQKDILPSQAMEVFSDAQIKKVNGQGADVNQLIEPNDIGNWKNFPLHVKIEEPDVLAEKHPELLLCPKGNEVDSQQLIMPSMQAKGNFQSGQNESSFNGYKCRKCHKKFTALYDLNVHKAVHSNKLGKRRGRKKNRCNMCGKSYASLYELRRHRALHTNPDLFKCKVCGKSYSGPHARRLCLTFHANEGLYKCEKCGKAFKQAQSLQVHLEMHLRREALTCEPCGKSFANENVFREHQALHLNPESFKCQKCGICFYGLLSLKAHKIVHPIHQCDKCKKFFSSPRTLTGHKKLHMNPDIFKCDECGKSYRYRNSLEKHKAMHSNPEICKCEESYRGMTVLKMHQITHWNVKCDKCGKSLDRFIALNVHKASHSNPDLYKCNECQMTFGNYMKFTKHNLYHRNANLFKCDKCSKSFINETALKKHLTENKCGKSFKSFKSPEANKALHLNSDRNKLGKVFVFPYPVRRLKLIAKPNSNLKTNPASDVGGNITKPKLDLSIDPTKSTTEGVEKTLCSIDFD